MFKAKYIIFALSLFLLGCNTKHKLSNIDWVLGKWQVNDSTSFEEWEKVDNNLYRGKGYKIRKNDTTITETIIIVQKGKEVFYIPTVADQNEGKPVEFKLISKGTEKFIFENKNHDFPQRIIYAKNGSNQVDAKIEGTKEGFFSEVKFTLNRAN